MNWDSISSLFKSKQKKAYVTPSRYRLEDSSIELDDEALAAISGGAAPSGQSDPVAGLLGGLTSTNSPIGGVLTMLGPLPSLS